MKTLVAFALAAILPGSVFSQDDAGRWDARVASAHGTVSIHPADGSEEVSAEAGMPLEQGDRVMTSSGAWAEIALDGGSLITLRENSDFSLEDTQKTGSSFMLALGCLVAKIQKLGEARMRVRTPTAVAAVRGTEFGVEVEPPGQTHVGVFDEGEVEVSGASGGAEVIAPQQETTVLPGRAPLSALPLRRFLVRRELVRRQRGRLQEVRRGWRALNAEKRREARRTSFERMRERRRQSRQRLEEFRRKREKVQELRREDRRRGLKKMEKRREGIRRRGPGGP